MLKSLLLSCLMLEAAAAQWFTRRPTPTPTPVAPPSAIQSLYGQCGGQTYTGPTQCPPGAYCKFDGNIWYEQCVAIETDAGGQPSVSTRTSTTVVTVGPTVVTTFITYLTPKPTTTRSAQVVTITVVPDDPCDHEYLC